MVHALGCPPDEVAFAELLGDAGLNAARLELATSEDIANKRIIPRAFDRVLVILGDEMAADKHLEAGMLGVAQCGMSVVGIWDRDAVSNEMHPAVRRYSDRQITWNFKDLLQSIVSKSPQMFQSLVGEPTRRHKVTHHNCGVRLAGFLYLFRNFCKHLDFPLLHFWPLGEKDRIMWYVGDRLP